MLDESDNIARKVAYAKGKRDMAETIYLEISTLKELDHELCLELCKILVEADKEYSELQNKYIDIIGGSERLKV